MSVVALTALLLTLTSAWSTMMAGAAGAAETAGLAAAQVPSCQSPATHATPTATPTAAATAAPPSWPLQRFAVDRISGLADGRGVTVAVIDSGVDATHPQLRGGVRAGDDLLDGAGALVDCVGHGTAVASVIAARPVAGTEFRGLAPGATILSMRVSEQVDVEGGGTAGRRGTGAGLATAIRRSTELGAKVINLSLVSYADDPAVRDAISFAVRRDVVVVAAAGNRFGFGDSTPFPAAYDGVLGVGAIGPDGRRVATSQAGPYVDLVAPGDQIVTADTPTGHATHSGTSFAAAFVAGAAALVRQYHPGLSASQVAARLLATADTPSGGTPGKAAGSPSGVPAGGEYGSGVLNPYRALTEHLGAAPAARAAGPALAPLTRPDQAAGHRATVRALALSGGLLGLTALTLAAAVVVPRGARRRWRAGPDHRPS